MIFDGFLKDPELRRYVESSLVIASRVLEQFTTDKINKNLLFFDLLDIESILFANSKSLLINMLVFTYRRDSLM